MAALKNYLSVSNIVTWLYFLSHASGSVLRVMSGSKMFHLDNVNIYLKVCIPIRLSTGEHFTTWWWWLSIGERLTACYWLDY